MNGAARLLAALLIIAAFTETDAFWGRKAETLPDRRDTVRKGLLWVPAATALDWDALRSFVERRPDARFTLALAPEEIPEVQQEWLTARASEGRIEIAMRIPGDPILPLAGRERPQLAAEKLAISRLHFKKIFNTDPTGFIPGGGALTPADARHLRGFNIQWAAVGDGEFSNAWYGEEQLILMPFHAIISTETLPPATDTAALVIDEVAGGVPAGSGLGLLEHLSAHGADESYSTVAEIIASIRPFVVGPASWPTWRGDLSFWTDAEEQRAAWGLYREAAREVRDYQNSGSALIGRLDRAEFFLTQARGARNFVRANILDPEKEKAFRAALAGAYKAIGESPPKTLADPIAPGAMPADDLEGERPSSGGDVLVRVAANQLSFTNPARSEAALPLAPPPLPPQTTASAFWTPRALELRWSEKTVDFKFTMGSLFPSERTAHGFDRLLLDLYIDINNLPGRGSTALLSRRQGFVEPEDAWEYVLVVSGTESGLYRSLSGHPPSLIAALEPVIDLKKATVSLSVPRARLPGNPAAWGYVLAVMAPLATGEESFGAPHPGPGASGSPILGMLGSLEEQRDLAAKRESTYRRFSALRAGQSDD